MSVMFPNFFVAIDRYTLMLMSWLEYALLLKLFHDLFLISGHITMSFFRSFCLPLQTLTNDVIAVIRTMYGDSPPAIILVGHRWVSILHFFPSALFCVFTHYLNQSTNIMLLINSSFIFAFSFLVYRMPFLFLLDYNLACLFRTFLFLWLPWIIKTLNYRMVELPF